MANGAPHVRLAENIALLEFLGKIPARPSRNAERDEDPELSLKRILPLRVEKDLVSTLAVLSSIKDDPNMITAVCVQEVGSSLSVLLAANAKEAGSSPYLDSVKVGFTSMFQRLRKASTTSRDELERGVFQSIVAMCRKRIMSRARFVASESKPPLQEHLRKAIQSLDQLKGKSSERAFRAAATELIKSLDRCGKASSPAGHDGASLDTELQSLIEAFCDFLAVPNLERVLLVDLELAKPKMDPKARLTLISVSEKMSQYKSSVTRLIKIARKYSVVRRASVLLVLLQQSDCERAKREEGGRERDLEEVFRRTATANGADSRFETICSKMKKEPGAAKLGFEETLNNTLAKSKIHAEVQLLWHLEKYPGPKPPRIIASNKDACYMYNALIAFQGRYTIPRSHGRIYPGWRLPRTNLGDLVERFTGEIEKKIICRASQILGGKVATFEYPPESTIFSAMGPMSTILTMSSVGSEVESSDNAETPRQNTPLPEAEPPVERTDNAQALRPDMPLPETEPRFESPDGSQSESSDSTETLRPSTPLPEAELRPERGAVDDSGHGDPSPDAVAWKSVSHGETALAHASPAVRLYVEYTAAPERSRRRLRFRTQQRSADPASGPANSAGEEDEAYDMGHGGAAEVVCRRGCRVVSIRLGDQVVEVELDDLDGGDA